MPMGWREPGGRRAVWASFVALLLATPIAGLCLDPGTAITQYDDRQPLWQTEVCDLKPTPAG